MKTLTFEIDGRTVTGKVVLSSDTIWFHIEGKTYARTDEKTVVVRERRRDQVSTSTEANGANSIRAPMPGKIVKVSVGLGHSVHAQQTLIVMEAMKMEYTLKAETESRVAEVLCQVGQQVNLGAVLMRLEKSDGGK